MQSELTTNLKAYLLSIGSVRIEDSSILQSSLKTTATAGPGAGGSSFFFAQVTEGFVSPSMTFLHSA